MEQLPLTQFEKNSVLSLIDLLESGHICSNLPPDEAITNPTSHEQIHLHLYWPWDWNWFGLNKREHSKHERKMAARSHTQNDFRDPLPGNSYFGACELFAGALLCIIPHPLTWSAGGTLILDGGRRLIEGMVQLSDERRADPNFSPPSKILNYTAQASPL